MFFKVAKMGKSGKRYIDHFGLRKLYSEHPSFGEKLYTWMAQHNPPKYKVDLKTWLECCDKLLRVPSRVVFGEKSAFQISQDNSRFHFYNKVEYVCMIASRCEIGKFDSTVITWNMAFKCIKNIIWLFNSNQDLAIIPKSDIDIVTRSIVATMTTNQDSKMEFYGNIP